MSSYKLWRTKGQHCDTKSDSYNTARKTPPFLRLNSTGEVFSADTIQGQAQDMCRGNKYCSNSRSPKMSLCQSVKNSLSMSTMIDTASSYLNTASSYIESIYPYRTRKCLVNSTPSNYNNMDFSRLLDKDNSMTSLSNGHEGLWPGKMSEESHVSQRLKKAWTQEFLGAIHSTVFNKDMSQDSANKQDRYIPPPLKHRQLQEKRCCTVFKDPKLTPYNAKLLEKSKRCEESKHCEEMSSKNDKPHPTLSAKDTIFMPEDMNKNSVTSVQPPSPQQNSVSPIGSNHVKENDLKDIKPNQTTTIDEKKKDESEKETCSSPVPDWFEYECRTENLIPVTINEKLLDKGSAKIYDIEQDPTAEPTSDCAKRLLHSWSSMESDADVKKAKCAQNIPLAYNSSQSHCDKQSMSEGPANSVNVHDSGENCVKGQASVSAPSKTEHVSKSNVAAKIRISFKKQEETDKKNPLISVLYTRNGAHSKRRPSAQKRIRHKIQKCPEINSCKGTADSKSPLKEGNSLHPNGSVAFVLGLDCDEVDSCFSMQSFQMNCDIEELDWSTSDENDSDCQLDDVDCCEDFDLFSPLKGLVNFQVRCSVESVPSTATPSYHEYSQIDKINREWDMNVSVKDTNIQKKSTSKKVAFKDDKDLTEVHPIIAWSYAYQAARKGHWEEIARDRGRFQRRITDGERILKPILETEHRNAVFKERFQ